RSDARVQEVHNEVFDLMIDLDAPEEAMEFQPVFAIAREGMATLDASVRTNSLEVLYEKIINEVPPPHIVEGPPLQMMISNLSYSSFVGRLAIGRIRSGRIKVGDEVLVMQDRGVNKKIRVSALFQYQVNNQVPVDEIGAGDIAIIAGLEDFNIGDTVTSV